MAASRGAARGGGRVWGVCQWADGQWAGWVGDGRSITHQRMGLSLPFPAAPLDRILVETDAPYLAPPPKRGKRNEPAFTAHTARRAAETFGLDYPTFAARTEENFERLFTKAAAHRIAA